MKSVIAGVAGVLVATLGVAAWQARTAAPAYPGSNGPGFVDADRKRAGRVHAAQGMPLAVRCAPGQQAVMRQIVVDGQLTAAAECTDAAMPSAYGASLVQPVSSDIVQWQPPRVVPASYTVRERAPRRAVVREEPPAQLGQDRTRHRRIGWRRCRRRARLPVARRAR